MIKKSFLLSVLYISFVLLGPRDGICQTTYTPDQWQTTLASTEDDYECMKEPKRESPSAESDSDEVE